MNRHQSSPVELNQFLLDAANWIRNAYPQMTVKAVIFEFGTGEQFRLPTPKVEEKSSSTETTVRSFLTGRKGRMSAAEIRAGMEQAGMVYGQSTIERALARLRKKGVVSHGNDDKGHGYLLL